MPDETDMQRVINPLVLDAKESLRYVLGGEKAQFWRRTHVRAVFALIEGWLFVIRQMILSYVKVGLVQLAPGDVALLQESQFDLDSNGELRVTQKFVSFEKTFRFLFRCSAITFQTGYRIDTSTQGWASLRAAQRIRNRITHPRAESELTISDAEIKIIEDAFAYFQEASLAVSHSRENTA